VPLRPTTRDVLVLVVTTFALCAAACASSPHTDGGGVVVAGSGEPASTGAPSGEDVADLVPREREAYERLIETTLAPCSDEAVPLDVCLDEKRPCSACGPAARFLLDRVKAGLAKSDIQRAYGLRFGNDVRNVDVADSPAKGPADAPVTIMVWSDFECPACKRIVPMVERVFAAHDKDVRLVHKLYPLSKHPHAEMAARAAFAAKLQGRYWQMERELFENQEKLAQDTINEIAEDLGLDMARFRADAQSPAAKKVIDRDMADADRSGLAGTPFILINGREFDLELFKPEPDLEAWVAMEIALARSAAKR
jgi:protein-disulfide isomerase